MPPATVVAEIIRTLEHLRMEQMISQEECESRKSKILDLLTEGAKEAVLGFGAEEDEEEQFEQADEADQAVEQQTEARQTSKDPLAAAIGQGDFEEVKRLVSAAGKSNSPRSRRRLVRTGSMVRTGSRTKPESDDEDKDSSPEHHLLWTRGAVGELPIHLCFLLKQYEIAKLMVEACPKLIQGIYEGTEYTGENLLHIAIVAKNFDIIKWLVEASPSLMKGQATGNFFRYGKPCYYGEYPLGFAACTSQKQVVEYLVAKGASLDFEDSYGNNLLHLMVIHNLPEMYDFVEQMWIEHNSYDEEKWELAHSGLGSSTTAALAKAVVKATGNRSKPLWKRTNNESLTPFALSADVGNKDMFVHLLSKGKVVQWSYGPVTCVIYPLEDMDTFNEDAKGALTVIVDKERLDLLMLPRVRNLLDMKWHRFGARKFWLRFMVTLSFLMIFMVASILQPKEGRSYGPKTVIAKHVTETVVVICACWKLLTELGEMRGDEPGLPGLTEGIRQYFSTRGSAFLENALSLLAASCVISGVMLRYIGSSLDDALWGIASLLGWTYMLFFLLGFRTTGPLVIMLIKMFVKDVLRFVLLYIVFLMGFSQAFFVVCDEFGMKAFVMRIKNCFQVMLGELDMEDYYGSARYPGVATAMLIIYVITVSIMLLNLLIAMMGDTYSAISEESERQWHLERARIIFSMENEMGPEERNKPCNKYWVIGPMGRRYLQLQQITKNW